MSYSNELLLKATQTLESRRNKAQRIQLARHLEVTDKIPEIAKCEAQLSSTGLDVVKALGMGKDAEKLGLAAQAHARKTHDSEHNLNTLVAIYKTVGGKE